MLQTPDTGAGTMQWVQSTRKAQALPWKCIPRNSQAGDRARVIYKP